MNHRNFEELGMLALVLDGPPLPEVHDEFHAYKILVFSVLLGYFDLDSDLYTAAPHYQSGHPIGLGSGFLRPRAGGYPIRFFSTDLLSGFVVWRQNKVLPRLKSVFTGEPLLLCLRVVICRLYMTYQRAWSVNIAVCAVYARVVRQIPLKQHEKYPIVHPGCGESREGVVGSRRGVREHVCLVWLLYFLRGCTDMDPCTFRVNASILVVYCTSSVAAF